MTSEQAEPSFVPPAKTPSTKSDRARALIVLLGTLLIAGVGIAEVAYVIDSLPVESDDLFCIDEYAVYGLPSAYDRAVLWVTASVWLGFGALVLVTYSRSSLWRSVAAASATGLFLVGACASFFILAAASCWGS